MVIIYVESVWRIIITLTNDLIVPSYSEIIVPDLMVPGTKYVVEYGTTQQHSSIGSKPRDITVLRQGLSSEMDFYREGRPMEKGVWVVDHSDNDVEKFFFHSRFIDIQPEWYDLL